MKYAFLLLVSLNALAAEKPAHDPYIWEKDIGNNRVERGRLDTVFLSSLSRKFFRTELVCGAGEVLINGGCSIPYGFRLDSSFPFSSRSTPTRNTWVCAGTALYEEAMDSKGSHATPETPHDELQGAMEVVITCEKR